jgi:hypothetical protein
MFNCQQALITHLKTNFNAHTVDAYAGQVKDANKLCEILPAILCMYVDGTPVDEEPIHNFDLICVTENDILDKLTGRNVNLKLTSDVSRWIKENRVFRPEEGSGSYAILTDREIPARTILIDDRFCITALALKIKDHT